MNATGRTLLCAFTTASGWTAVGQASAGTPERALSVTYDVVVSAFPDDAESFEMWLPLPVATPAQDLGEIDVTCDLPYAIASDPEYGNRILHVHDGGEPPDSVRTTITFDVVRRRVDRRSLATADGVTERNGALRRFLLPDRLVPIDGRIAAEAEAAGGALEDPIARARALYDHVVASVTYDKSGSGWGEGDALHACNVRTGNCTDFHSLFIGLARASGLPARFVMGFPVPVDRAEGEIAGYHCWAEFHVEGVGWLPVDASEASKNPDRAEELFGGLDENRVAFTLGRDILLPSGRDDPERLNYFIYPHVLVNGEVHHDVNRYVSFVDRSAG